MVFKDKIAKGLISKMYSYLKWHMTVEANLSSVHKCKNLK